MTLQWLRGGMKWQGIGPQHTFHAGMLQCAENHESKGGSRSARNPAISGTRI